MKTNEYNLTNLASKEWKNFALYVLENRAIPNMISGFKPVQNFYVYSSLQNSAKDFEKVSAIGNVVSKYGYNHGESSCSSAGQLMSSTWANNICLIEGRGSFGSRLVQKAGADRYTYTRLHSNFSKYYKDLDLAPSHEDPEYLPPKFYVPIIPMVLVNGIKGVATGFATNIPPHDPNDLVNACKEYIETGDIKKTKVNIKYPDFNGSIVFDETEQKTFCVGIIKRASKTQFDILEVPYGYDREKYVEILDSLEDKGIVHSYTDKCDKTGFKFSVKLKQTCSDWDDKKIIKEFKLSTTISENITVIDYNNKLREYTDKYQLIKDFCDYRLSFLNKRIDKKISDLSKMNRWLTIKGQFIMSVLNDKIVFKNKSKSDVFDQTKCLIDNLTEEEMTRLLQINIMSLTKDMVEVLKKEVLENIESLKYWKTTTNKDQFLEDLK